ncbi:MAG: N-acetylmuramoyl-L-alanine amidase family protein [Clostridiales bacterium]|nr:N-acetylmuramoyl-L-alanine amidase family protein [Clostridiales bacterium]
MPLFLLVLAIGPDMAQAAQTELALHIDGYTTRYSEPEVKLVINGVAVNNDSLAMPPILLDGRAYVPVRAIFEKMGAIVDWKPSVREIFIGFGESLIVLTVDRTDMFVDGRIVQAGAAPKIVNERTLVPVKYLSEALGFDVGWSDSARIVSIDNRGLTNDEPADPTAPVVTVPDAGTPLSDPLVVLPVSDEYEAVDASPSDIPAMDLPTARITSIALPTADDPYTFSVSASSAVSRVTKTYIEGNRLVIDIINAENALAKGEYEVEHNPLIRRVRAGQFETEPMTARLVFDLAGSVRYSVGVSSDRETLIISFGANRVTEFKLESDGVNDYIYIIGETRPSVSITVLTEPDRIVIDTRSAAIETAEIPVSGEFAYRLRSSVYMNRDARIVADLTRSSGYTVTYSGSAALVTLTEVSYKHVSVDNGGRRVVLPKAAAPGLSSAVFSARDRYADSLYELDLGGDFGGAFGHGQISVNTDYIDSVEITTENGSTRLIIKENQILAFTVTEDDENVYISARPPKEAYSRIVVIDPGHGGAFPGTEGNGIVEKELNLAIALKVIDMLEKEGGVKVYATRLTDADLDKNLSSDLLKRSALANAVGDMFVSIHNNSYTTSSVGTETYWCDKNNATIGGLNSKRLAAILQDSMTDRLGSYDRGVKSGDLSVLKYSKVPAALVEVGFVSNPGEAAKLRDDGYRTEAARAIYEGIMLAFDEYIPVR